ncbi:glycoside hydrolase family 15 protein [Dyella acidiphila]|uniref:Glycoside hydrolase family 15 protein n=1 Tax=Dyella acidiphila TaxID=2775866 RepID=A0ABR9GCW1_9GAMM|nr:glycoside hydrolase family 15 protein [Dyella acidiphila]MBE1161829.1 glycoside hydrolase family 15 protein [Dyella acidiphila]
MALHDINDYAAVGDCHGFALVAADGSLDWCALPDLDAEPVCCRLLDDRIGGYLETRPHEAFRAERRYLPDTNVLETLLSTDRGSARIIDFMPLGRAGAQAGNSFVQIAAPHWFVRIVEVIHGQMQIDIRMLPCLHWGEQRAQLRDMQYGVAWDGGGLLCDRPLEARDYWAGGSVNLQAGERMRLILSTRVPDHAQAALDSVDPLLAITTHFWHEWIARCRYRGPYAGEVRRSALALKLLCYAPTGAIAAAGTTSLPEMLGGDRNWDYRLSWIRDSTLSLFALSALGFMDEPEEFCDFVFRHAAADIIPSQIVYGIRGERELTECDKPALQGFGGSRPVRVGNAAYLQDQFDVFGELLDWMLLRKTLGAAFSSEQLALLARTADHVAANWRRPCSDFWERRNAPAHYVYSKMMSWVALDRACVLLDDERRYGEEMDAMVEEVHRHAMAPSGYLRQLYDRDDVGALSLRVPLINFPLPDNCLAATIEEVLRELDTGTGVYRYKGDDGLQSGEGTFVACGFWLVDALLFAGRRQEARDRFERMLKLASPLGLYAEEADAQSGRQLGNFPQALSHLALIHSAVLLEIVEHHGEEALGGTHSHRVHRATTVLQGLDETDEDAPAPSAASVLDLAALGLVAPAARERQTPAM